LSICTVARGWLSTMIHSMRKQSKSSPLLPSSVPRKVVCSCCLHLHLVVLKYVPTTVEEETKYAAIANRGLCHFYLDQLDLAIANLSTAIEHGMRNEQLFSTRATAYQLQGKDGLAEADRKQGLLHNPRAIMKVQTYYLFDQFEKGSHQIVLARSSRIHCRLSLLHMCCLSSHLRTRLVVLLHATYGMTSLRPSNHSTITWLQPAKLRFSKGTRLRSLSKSEKG